MSIAMTCRHTQQAEPVRKFKFSSSHLLSMPSDNTVNGQSVHISVSSFARFKNMGPRAPYPPKP